MPPRYSREITRPAVLGAQLKEQFRTSPCETSCPIGNSIQKMNSLIEKGQFTEALRYLRAKNPFPGITGRVCPHFCMDACNRKEMDGCLNIRALERAAETFAERGNVFYDLYEDVADSRAFCFIERWADEEAVAAHNASPHFRAWTAAKAEFVEAGTVARYRQR